MIINDIALLRLSPIKDMLQRKMKGTVSSHGLTEAGYDLRLKQQIQFTTRFNGWARIPAVKVTDEFSNVVVTDGRFVLASAIEEFDMPSNLVGVVHDKSTWARHGLSVFNTVIEPGFIGGLTLELVYHGQDDLIIPAGVGIAQVLFHNLAIEKAYSGKYQFQSTDPEPARKG